MIWYFWKSLKPSIKIKMEQQDRASTDFKKIMQRVVNAKAKISLQSSAIVWNADSYCPRGHRFSNNIASKVQIQGTTAENLRSKEPKAKNPKLALPFTNVMESSEEQNKKNKKNRKDKKKKF